MKGSIHLILVSLAMLAIVEYFIFHYAFQESIQRVILSRETFLLKRMLRFDSILKNIYAGLNLIASQAIELYCIKNGRIERNIESLDKSWGEYIADINDYFKQTSYSFLVEFNRKLDELELFLLGSYEASIDFDDNFYKASVSKFLINYSASNFYMLNKFSPTFKVKSCFRKVFQKAKEINQFEEEIKEKVYEALNESLEECGWDKDICNPTCTQEELKIKIKEKVEEKLTPYYLDSCINVSCKAIDISFVEPVFVDDYAIVKTIIKVAILFKENSLNYPKHFYNDVCFSGEFVLDNFKIVLVREYRFVNEVCTCVPDECSEYDGWYCDGIVEYRDYYCRDPDGVCRLYTVNDTKNSCSEVWSDCGQWGCYIDKKKGLIGCYQCYCNQTTERCEKKCMPC